MKVEGQRADGERAAQASGVLSIAAFQINDGHQRYFSIINAERPLASKSEILAERVEGHMQVFDGGIGNGRMQVSADAEDFDQVLNEFSERNCLTLRGAASEGPARIAPLIISF